MDETPAMEKKPAGMEQFEKSHLTDVALVVEGQQLWMSRAVLAHFSPVFERMFFGDFRETRDLEVPLPDKSLANMLELFSCLVPSPDVKEVDWDNVILLFSMAEEYQMPSLTRRCAEFLRWQAAELADDDDRLLDALILAAWLDAEELQNRLLPKVARLGDEKISQDQLQQLPPAVLAAYYQAKLNKARSRLPHLLSQQDGLGHCLLHSHYAGKVRRCNECQQSFCDQHARLTACKCHICGKNFTFSDSGRVVDCGCGFEFEPALLTKNGPMTKAKFLAVGRFALGRGLAVGGRSTGSKNAGVTISVKKRR